MKNFIKSLTFMLFMWVSVIVYGATSGHHKEHHGAVAQMPTSAALASSAPNAASTPGGYWLEAHTSVHVNDDYQWLIAVIMVCVVLFVFEESEGHHKKKKKRH